jgi:hypothetical protein
MKAILLILSINIFGPWLIAIIWKYAEVIEQAIANHQVIVGCSLILLSFFGLFKLLDYWKKTDQVW